MDKVHFRMGWIVYPHPTPNENFWWTTWTSDLGTTVYPLSPHPLKKKNCHGQLTTVDNLHRIFGYDDSCFPTSFIHLSGFNNTILFSPSTKILKRGLHPKHTIKVMYVTVETLLLGLADLIRPWNKSFAPTHGIDIYFTYQGYVFISFTSFVFSRVFSRIAEMWSNVSKWVEMKKT